MNYTSQEALNLASLTFNHYKEIGSELWKITVDGCFFKTAKGKSSWSRKHQAKSAFLNFLNNNSIIYTIHSNLREQDPTKNHWQNKPTKQEIHEFIRQLEEINYVEFVQIA